MSVVTVAVKVTRHRKQEEEILSRPREERVRPECGEGIDKEQRNRVKSERRARSECLPFCLVEIVEITRLRPSFTYILNPNE